MTKAVLLTASALLWSVQAFTAGPAHAAAGALDPTFGQGGQVTISFSNNNVIVEDAILQPDGKIAVAAMFTEIVADADTSDSFGVVRLLPNGSLDPNFGTGGAARIAFGNFDATPNVLALQPGGKIVVVGQGAFLSQWVAARFFNGNGTLDSSFGAGGTAQTNIAGFQSGLTSISSILIDPRNAQILVGGSGRVCTKCATETVIVRYNPNGSLDPTFGNGGMIAIAAVGAPDALALLSNGDILATGSGAVAEFEASGSLLSTVMSTISSATIVAAAQGGRPILRQTGILSLRRRHLANLAAGIPTFSWCASCRKAVLIAHSTARSSISARKPPSARAPGRLPFSRMGRSSPAAQPANSEPRDSVWHASTPMAASTPHLGTRAK
jgi:uncharacterized delta-60 repeat protein